MPSRGVGAGAGSELRRTQRLLSYSRADTCVCRSKGYAF
jgi:hypothetical protein